MQVSINVVSDSKRAAVERLLQLCSLAGGVLGNTVLSTIKGSGICMKKLPSMRTFILYIGFLKSHCYIYIGFLKEHCYILWVRMVLDRSYLAKFFLQLNFLK